MSGQKRRPNYFLISVGVISSIYLLLTYGIPRRIESLEAAANRLLAAVFARDAGTVLSYSHREETALLKLNKDKVSALLNMFLDLPSPPRRAGNPVYEYMNAGHALAVSQELTYGNNEVATILFVFQETSDGPKCGISAPLIMEAVNLKFFTPTDRENVGSSAFYAAYNRGLTQVRHDYERAGILGRVDIGLNKCVLITFESLIEKYGQASRSAAK